MITFLTHTVCIQLDRVSVPSMSVRCPFNDAYWLAYNNNSGGFCTHPASYVSPCASNTHLQFRLQKCSHAAYTYQRGTQHAQLSAYFDTLKCIIQVTGGCGRGLAIKRSRVRVSAGHYGVKTLGKFLTPMCLCHQAV